MKRTFGGLVIMTVLVTASARGGHLPITTGASSWTSGDFTYDGAGNVIAIGTDVYVYDSAGRLIRGTANGPDNRQDYSYDSFGNRLHADTTGAPCVGTLTCGGIAVVDWGTNRLTDHNARYDAAGNLAQYDPNFDPANAAQSKPLAYAYDGIGMISSITASDNVRYEYVYTVDDERLATNTNGGSWRFTLRAPDQHVLREVNAYVGSNGTNWLWDRDHVYRGQELLATVSANGTQQFHLDYTDTARVVTDAGGGKIGYHAYYPFGEELLLLPREAPEERLKFTGHERDAVGSGGLDYMHARFFAGVSGRFLSVDPVLGKPELPQTWNRYAYVRNNPLNFSDPTGRWTEVCKTGDTAACRDAADRFEEQRLNDLKSDDPQVREAAAAYGERGEANHVYVGFASREEVQQRAGAGATSGTQSDFDDDTHEPFVTVLFSTDLKCDELARSIAHEGIHVGDHLQFLNSYNAGAGRYDGSLDFSLYTTEFRAYSAGEKVLHYDFLPRGAGFAGALDAFLLNEYRHPKDLVRDPCDGKPR